MKSLPWEGWSSGTGSSSADVKSISSASCCGSLIGCSCPIVALISSITLRLTRGERDCESYCKNQPAVLKRSNRLPVESIAVRDTNYSAWTGLRLGSKDWWGWLYLFCFRAQVWSPPRVAKSRRRECQAKFTSRALVESVTFSLSSFRFYPHTYDHTVLIV